MPTRVPVLDVAVARLAARDLAVGEVHGLARAALRTGAPKLLDVLALRAGDGYADAAGLAAHLDAQDRWPDECLAHPQDALALATVWAVGDEAWRAQRRARAAYADILERLGPEPFADAEAAAFLFAQLAFFADDRAELERLLGILPLSPAEQADLRLDLANPYAARPAPGDPVGVAAKNAWLELFNARFREAGLSPVAVDDSAEHAFDGLHAEHGPSVDGPLVTVIVPCFRPDAPGLMNSVRSMIAQTYANQEILLVDDASGPGYGDVFDEAAALDPRVEIVRMPVNGGSYLGRNAAIARARGHFITTQDADDWSHPQRLADQVKLLRDNPFAPASRSDAIRALDDLTVSWLGYPSRRRNASSFMVRRSTIETVGVFDTVRKGADSEYHERVERRLGPTLDTSTPGAITRLRGGSLSRSDFRMLWMTPDRALYRASFRAWHDTLTPASPPLLGPDQLRRRAFPASWSFRRNLPGGTAPRTAYDVVFLVDLTAPSALTREPTRSLIMSKERASAIVFQEDPTSGRPRRPNTLPRATSPVLSGRIDLISASDAATAPLLVVLTPGLLEMPSLDAPRARADRIVALLPEPSDGVAADLLAMREGGRAIWGRDVEWVAPTPELAAEWSRDLGERVPDLERLLAGVGHRPGPVGGTREGTTGADVAGPDAAGESAAPRRVVLLAEDSGAAGHVAHQWALAHAGEDVRATVVHTSRRPLRGLPPTVKQVHLSAGTGGAELHVARRLLGSLTSTPLVAKAFAAADELVVPDGKAGAGRKAVSGRGAVPGRNVTVTEWKAFVERLTDTRHRQVIERHAQGASGRTSLAVAIAEACAAAYRSPELVEAIGRAGADLLAATGYRELAGLRAAFAALPAGERDANGLEAIVRIAELTLGSGPRTGDAAVARTTFDAAMERVDRGELPAAVRLVTLGLRLVFHSELHADGQRSLIVDDPQAVLAPWRESRFGRYVASLAAAAETGAAEVVAAPADRPRVVVLAGAYGSFYQPVLDVLRQAGYAPDLVRSDDLGPLLKRRDPTEQLVGAWLRLADPGSWGALPEDRGADRQLRVLAGRLEGADVVFADWCDPGALFASFLAPPQARMVIRMHRVDATKAWAQLVNWPRVAEVLLVSEHVQAFVAPQLARPGEPLPARLTVVNNIIDVGRYRRPKLPGAHRTIAMVGWGRRVKDPIFAVEILRRLLRSDPAWRLHLIGRDFADSALTPVADYLARFRELTADPQVRDAIVWVGFTRHLEDALDECGFVLSTSVVEGWPVGVVEAAVSGCIPVIRDWPQVAAHGGARQIYADTADWVVSTPEEGAARIAAFADRQAWAEESARSRDAADRLAATGATAQDYLRSILGSRATGT